MFKTLIFLPFVHFGWLLGMDIFDLPLPDLTSFPSYGHFFTGENITLNCRCQCPAIRIQYYHNRNPTNQSDYDKRQCRTYLEYNVTVAIGGIYSCECLDWREESWRRSNLSHPIQINIADRLSQPTINKFKNVGLTSSSEIVLISCNGDIRSSGGMFHLYRNRSMQPVQSHQMNGDQRTATFKVNVTGNDYLGCYGCRYQTHVLGNWTDSPWSKDVVVTENDQELHMSMPDIPPNSVPLVRHCLSALLLVGLVLIIVEHKVNDLSQKVSMKRHGMPTLPAQVLAVGCNRAPGGNP